MNDTDAPGDAITRALARAPAASDDLPGLRRYTGKPMKRSQTRMRLRSQRRGARKRRRCDVSPPMFPDQQAIPAPLILTTMPAAASSSSAMRASTAGCSPASRPPRSIAARPAPSNGQHPVPPRGLGCPAQDQGGRDTTYGALVDRLGRPKAMRAVGMANGANPIGVIVPCHRMIGANGSLTGCGGGMLRKQWLLIPATRRFDRFLDGRAAGILSIWRAAATPSLRAIPVAAYGAWH